MSKVFQTMAASLRHAAWTNKAAIIGGGVYNRDECSAAAEALETFPAMLAALRETLRDLDAVTGVDDHGSDTIGCMENRIRAILSRIDGAPTAQLAGDDPAITAAANLSRAGLVEAAGEALALQAPISEAGDHCASCGAEEGESHGAQCEARGFAMGADARRLDTGALRSVTGDDADWLEATASRDGGEC